MYFGPLRPVSNREDWQFTIELFDPDTNDFVDLTNSVVTVTVRPEENIATVLNGTNLDGHITVTGIGTANVLFPLSEMTAIIPGYYDLGITVKLESQLTYQLFAGTLPVIDGVTNP